MSRRDENDSTRTPATTHPSDPQDPHRRHFPPDPPNAFSPELFDELRHRDPHPATPEADFAGPWRLTRLHGAGPPLWSIYAAGDPAPSLTYQEPDLAHLGATALALAERPPRFRFERGEPHGGRARLHLLHDGHPVATVSDSIPETCSLPTDLTRLADLRTHPQALAHFLVAVPDEVLKRAGTLAMELLRGQRR